MTFFSSYFYLNYQALPAAPRLDGKQITASVQSIFVALQKNFQYETAAKYIFSYFMIDFSKEIHYYNVYFSPISEYVNLSLHANIVPLFKKTPK